MEEHEHGHENDHPQHRLTYFVNGERQESDNKERTVHGILQNAGFDPPKDYRLTRDEGNHVYEDYETEVNLHEGERFTATYVGPTPTS